MHDKVKGRESLPWQNQMRQETFAVAKSNEPYSPHQHCKIQMIET